MTPWPLLSSSPFDTESFCRAAQPPGKFSIGSRKGLLYNWTPPNTPSFRERYYLVSEPPWAGMWAGAGLGGWGVTPQGVSTWSAVHSAAANFGLSFLVWGVSGTFFTACPLCSVASGFCSGLDWGGVLQMLLPLGHGLGLICFALWNVFPGGNSLTSVQ